MTTRKYREELRERYGLSDPPYGERPVPMTQTMAELGNPEQEFQTVHVTGTNGAGSTSHFIADVLDRSGYTVGQFSDIKVIEMGGRDFFRIDGEPISGDALLELAADVTQQITATGEWETLVAMACEYFARNGVDIAVFEAGVGGREDATNVIYDTVSVIPSVGLDHADRLGGTIESVARHKAGIFDEGSIAVVNGPETAKRVARDVADEVGAEFHTPNEPVQFNTTQQGLSYTADYRGGQVSTAFIAKFYCENINTAVTALEASPFDVDVETILNAISAFQMPGRSELIAGEPSVLFDGAHNPHAANALSETLARFPPETDVTLVFRILGSNGWQEMIRTLTPHVDRIVGTRDDGTGDRQRILRDLSQNATVPAMLESQPRVAFSDARDKTVPDGVVVVSGAFSVCRELRPRVVEEGRTRPWRTE